MNNSIRYLVSMALLLVAALIPGVAWGNTVVVGPANGETPNVSIKVKHSDSGEWMQGVEAFCGQKVDVLVSVVLPGDVSEYSSFPLDVAATETVLAPVDQDSLKVSIDGADVTQALFNDASGVVFGNNAGDAISNRMRGEALPEYPANPGNGDKPWQLDGKIGVYGVDGKDVHVGFYDLTGLSDAKAGSIIEVRFSATVESYGRLDGSSGGWQASCTYPFTKDGEGNVQAYSDVVARCGCCEVYLRGCENNAYYSVKLLKADLMQGASEMYVMQDGRLSLSPREFETHDAGRFSVMGICSGVYSLERVDAPGTNFQLSVELDIDESTGNAAALNAEVSGGDARVEMVDAERRMVVVNLGGGAAASPSVETASADSSSVDENAKDDSQEDKTERDEGFDVGGALVVLLAIAFTAIALLFRRISRVAMLMKGGFR